MPPKSNSHTPLARVRSDIVRRIGTNIQSILCAIHALICACVSGIFVTKVTVGGAADQSEQVLVGDHVLSVNGASLIDADHMAGVMAVRCDVHSQQEALVLMQGCDDEMTLELVQDEDGARHSSLND